MSTKKRRRESLNDSIKSTKRPKFLIENVGTQSIEKVGITLVTGAGDVGQLGLGPDVLEKRRPALVPLEHEIVDVCAGGMHTVCLTKEGKVLTFGCNDEGALGRATSEEDAEFTAGVVELPGKVVQISAGDSHTAALLDDGRVFAWGTFRDSHGNLGLTPQGNEKLPYEIMTEVTIVKVASGADHVVFLTNHGEVYTCGCAEQGQLGRVTERSSSRMARARHGIDQTAKLLQPQPINLKPSLRLHFDNIWAGTYATFCKVAKKNEIYVFGLNNYSQLGLKSQKPQFIPRISREFGKYKWQQICCAPHHTIALDDKGAVYAIGRKEYGRLGLGKDCDDATELTQIPTLKEHKIVNIACGSATSFAVSEKGDLFGWGMGTNGQLGTGEEDDCYVPTLVKSKQLVDRQVFRVGSGGQHTVILAVTNNNSIQEEEEKI